MIRRLDSGYAARRVLKVLVLLLLTRLRLAENFDCVFAVLVLGEDQLFAVRNVP